MLNREGIFFTSVVVSLLLLWLGFLVHVDTRFAGSLPGFIVGMIALLLLLTASAYSLVKRIPVIKEAVSKRVPMHTLLALHTYTGVFAGFFAIIHSGHRFASPLGILLISFTLVTILSGFVGRYLMAQVSLDLKEKYALLDRAKLQYDRTVEQIRGHSDLAARVAAHAGFFSRLLAPLTLQSQGQGAANEVAAIESRAVRLGETVADLEYAVETHELFKRWFSHWLAFHIAASVALYLFLIFHIATEVRLGLRWLA